MARHWALTLGMGALVASGCIGTIGEGTEETGTVDDPICSGQAHATAVPLRRLTRSAYDNTIRDLLGDDAHPAESFERDERVAGFYDNMLASVSEGLVDNYLRAAESLAARAAENLETLVLCDPADGTSCAHQFIRTFGRRAWRRPLEEDEVARLSALFETGDDFADGVRLTLQAMLQSPYFLYRVELGGPPGTDGRRQLGGYELASKLSYLLWDTMPDDALLDAAERGTLDTPEGLRAEAERMLEDPRARDAMASFHLQWLGLVGDPELAGELQKDPDLYPEWSQELHQAMLRETAAFADHVVRFGDGELTTLLGADYTFVDEDLAALYGVDVEADRIDLPGAHPPAGMVPVSLPSHRGGLLTQASVLATFSKTNNTNIPRRGLFLAEAIFCQHVASPPSNLDPELPQPDPDASVRDKLTEETSVEGCRHCHSTLNPMGFLMESFDPVGRYRTEDEQGHTVDASGGLPGTDVEGDYADFAEARGALGTSEDVAVCVARAWFRYAFGPEQGVNECAARALEAELVASGNVRAFLLTLVQSDAFRYQQGE